LLSFENIFGKSIVQSADFLAEWAIDGETKGRKVAQLGLMWEPYKAFFVVMIDLKTLS
jgi:hypothetical protein